MDFDAFLAEALKVGVSVLEFWDLTPRETLAAIDAGKWRLDHEHRSRVWLAWHIAALSRARRMPELARLLTAPGGKPLAGDELARRRAEFEEMKARMWPVKSN